MPFVLEQMECFVPSSQSHVYIYTYMHVYTYIHAYMYIEGSRKIHTLPFAYCLLPFVNYLLTIADSLQPSANCPRGSAMTVAVSTCCLLPIAYGLSCCLRQDSSDRTETRAHDQKSAFADYVRDMFDAAFNGNVLAYKDN